MPKRYYFPFNGSSTGSLWVDCSVFWCVFSEVSVIIRGKGFPAPGTLKSVSFKVRGLISAFVRCPLLAVCPCQRSRNIRLRSLPIRSWKFLRSNRTAIKISLNADTIRTPQPIARKIQLEECIQNFIIFCYFVFFT